MRRSWIIIFILATLTTYSQTGHNDLDLLSSKQFTDTTYTVRHKARYVFGDANWLVKYNPISLLFGGGLLFYQGVISKQLMQGCAFEPSCSNFSRQCIKKYGIVKGVALSTDRLTRCTRLSAIDFHPVMFGAYGKVDDRPEYYQLRP